MDRSEKRALFDADWVPQVTYELITSERHTRQQLAELVANALQSLHDLDVGVRNKKSQVRQPARSTPHSLVTWPGKQRMPTPAGESQV